MVGNRASKTDHQPEISDINLMLPTPHLISSHLALTPLDQEGSPGAHHTHRCLM